MRLLILLSLFNLSTAKTRITTDYRQGGYSSPSYVKCDGGGVHAPYASIPGPQVTGRYNPNAKFTKSDITGYKTSTYNWKSQPYPNHYNGWFELVGEEHFNRYGNGGPPHATIVAAAEDTCKNIDECMMVIIYRQSGGRGGGLKAAFYWDASLCIPEYSSKGMQVTAIRFQKPPAKCSTLTCPNNYILKTSAGTINCATHECTANDDRDTCCDLTATCTDLTCPTSFIKKASSETIHCAATACVDSDRDTCCDALGKCSTLACQKSYVTKDPNIECKGATCTDDDRDTCCEIQLCGENEHAFNGTCHNCPAGKTNAAGNPATVDSECDTTFCLEDYHVVNNICQLCALGTRPAGDDASKGDTTCDVGPCGGLTCVRGTCVNNICQCPVGYSGMTCDRDVTALGMQKFLRSKRKAIPTKEDKKETRKQIRSFIKDTLKRALLTKSVKEAIQETKVAVDRADLEEKANLVVLQLEKQPVIALASRNKDTNDTCSQGINSPSCAMLDIKENPHEVVFLNTQEEAGSWSVLNSGNLLLSKQTRVTETIYDMQCWNKTKWTDKVRFDTSTDTELFECNDHLILIGSQAAVCTTDTCKNGGTCAPDGYSFTCTCPPNYYGSICQNIADITHCHQIDCSDFGGHKGGECTDCSISNCCEYATKTLFNNHCDTLSATQDYVNAKCCHRTYCL